MLLLKTDEAEAQRIADKVHAGIRPGAITVSIGLACAERGSSASASSSQLYRLADATLCDAKGTKRIQSRSAIPRKSSAIGQQASRLPIRAA